MLEVNILDCAWPRLLTCAALFSVLRGHLHQGVQHQSIVQPCVPVLQLLQEVSSCGFRHFSSGQFTQPLNEPRDVQQGYCWRRTFDTSQITDLFLYKQNMYKHRRFQHCPSKSTYPG